VIPLLGIGVKKPVAMPARACPLEMRTLNKTTKNVTSFRCTIHLPEDSFEQAYPSM
jgi:hypothetical protein